MAFESHLQHSLKTRKNQAALELAAGDSLETVLARHLQAVEASADTVLLTSILLLDEDRKRLRHAAAPSLPKVYCEAIDGIEIGSEVGSCGTAAFLGRAIYVTDIATDPLWKDFRDLALPHGLRACWSTPIRDVDGAMIGTFAIYHLTPRSPTPDEVQAIRLITDHVAQAIMGSNSGARFPRHEGDSGPEPRRRNLRLVSNNERPRSSNEEDDQYRHHFLSRLDAHAAKLERFAEMVETEEMAQALKIAAEDCRKLIAAIYAR